MTHAERLSQAITLAGPALLPGLPVEQICREHLKFRDNEIENSRILSPRSSAALVANTFGQFIGKPDILPNLFGVPNFDVPIFVGLEHCARFPWSGGKHPRLDVMIESPEFLIGVEAKRYEPFDQHKPLSFSDAYWRPVWGGRMQAFEKLRDTLHQGDWVPRRLDAAQLVKHAFGLRTEAGRRKKRPILVYLFAEPDRRPNGISIDDQMRLNHRSELLIFLDCVKDAEVQTRACTYRDLLELMAHSSAPGLSAHVAAVKTRFDL